MIEVTREVFLKAVTGPEEIHSHAHPGYVLWAEVVGDMVVGKTTPGRSPPPGKGKPTRARYYLSYWFAKTKGIQPKETK